VFVLQDGRIAVIDFGMVGRLSQARRAEVVNLLFGLVERDAERVTEVLLDWTGLESMKRSWRSISMRS
jgi:ubiquinone biosynthesis protein